jgi:hypothetical protein
VKASLNNRDDRGSPFDSIDYSQSAELRHNNKLFLTPWIRNLLGSAAYWQNGRARVLAGRILLTI